MTTSSLVLFVFLAGEGCGLLLALLAAWAASKLTGEPMLQQERA